MSFVKLGFMLVVGLVGMAFYTLLERKFLGYLQIRKGPNKTGVGGLLQPFSDVLKLLLKEVSSPLTSNSMVFFFSPILSLLVAGMLWLLMGGCLSGLYVGLGFLYFLCWSGAGVYGTFGVGWTSNSKYALLGALRAVAQTISYEISMAIICVGMFLLARSYSMEGLIDSQGMVGFWTFCCVFLMMWFSTCLAETNRAPFDFAEGESELVSGFNVEFSSGGFALIFMAEYLSIIFMCMVSVVLFWGVGTFHSVFFLLLYMFMVGFLWSRGVMPRFRYDSLMMMTWKVYLPVSLNLVVVLILLSVVAL